MKPLSSFTFYFFSIAIFFFSACGNDKKTTPAVAPDSLKTNTDSTPNRLTEEEYNTEYDSLRQTYKGAMIAEQIKQIMLANFSNTQTPDTFLLTIPAGPVSGTKSILNIITSDGNIIYADTLRTDYFAYEIFIPDSIPQNISEQSRLKFRSAYMNAVTKEQIENYVSKKIAAFFDGTFVPKSEIKINRPDEEEYITDKKLYEETIASADAKVIYIPCFDCEEGVSYYAYSKEKNKVLEIFAHD